MVEPKKSINGYFYVQPMHRKYVWDIEGGKKNNGAKLKLWDKNGGKNQLWKLEPAGPQWYAPKRKKAKIKMAFSNKTWDFSGGPEKAKQKGIKNE